MALQYLIEYKNLREEDIRVEIHDDRYSGSIIELDSVQGSAVSFTYDSEDDPILSHIIHKSIEMSVYSDGLDIHDIITSNDGQKTVRYLKNGQVKFEGFLLSDGLEDKETAISFEVKLKAVDGLSMLEDSESVMEEVLDLPGRVVVDGLASKRDCILNQFRIILNSGDYKLPELPIRWSSSLESTQSISGDILAGELQINPFDRLTRDRQIDVYWYLENLCKAFNLILEQRDGFWYIYSRKDVVSESGVLDFWEITSYIGKSDITAVKVPSVSLYSDSVADHINDDGNYIGLRPLSSAVVSYEDTRHRNILPNGSFDETIADEVLYWGTTTGTAGTSPGVPINIRGEGYSLRIDNNFDNSPELTSETSLISLVSGIYGQVSRGIPIDTNILFKEIEWGFIFSPIDGFNTIPGVDGDFINWMAEDGIEVSFRFVGLNKSGQKRSLYLNSFGYWTDESSSIYIRDHTMSGGDNNRTFTWNFEPQTSYSVRGDIFEVGIQKKINDPIVRRVYNITPGLTLHQVLLEISSKLVQDGYSVSSTNSSLTVSGINGMRAFFYNDGSSSRFIKFTVDELRLGDTASVKFQSKANQGSVLMPDSGVITPIKDIELGKLYVDIRVKPRWIIAFDDFYIHTSDNNDVFNINNGRYNGTEEYNLGISSSFSGFMDSSVGAGWEATDESMYFSDGDFSGTLTELYGAFAVSWRNRSLSIFTGTLNGDYSGFRLANIHGEKYYILSSSYNADRNTSKIKAIWADSLDYSDIVSERHYGESGGSGSGGGNGSGGGGGGGGIIQDLQSVLEVGNYATIGGNVSSWIIRDEAVIPNKPSTKENAIWIGAGVNPEPVLDRLVDLSDVSVSGVTDGQALVWSQSLGKWVNGQGGGSEYVLPIASASVLGGIRVGSGLSINPTTGVLSANVTSLDWDNITNKPVTFPPSSHTHPISQITGLQSALDAKANATVSINSGTGLTGGGNLTANRTISLSSATQSDIAKGVLAHGWGNHASAGYVKKSGDIMTGVLEMDTGSAVGIILSRSSQVSIQYNVGALERFLGVDSSGDLRFGSNINVGTTNLIYHSGNLRSNSDNDDRYVRLGNVNQTIQGIKTFGQEVRLPTTAGTGNNAIWIGAGVNPEPVDDYVLPIATASRLGGIKVGANLNITADGVLSAIGSGSGSVTSVGLSAPTGFSVSGSPVTSSGVLGLSFASGYSLPTTAKQGQWDTAYSQRHTHANKSVLDGITQAKVNSWDGMMPINTYRFGYDLNNHRDYGFWAGSATNSGRPTGAYEYSPYMNIQSSTDRFVQVWFDSYRGSSGGESIYLRGGTESAWNPWRRMWNDGDFTQSDINSWNAKINQAQGDARYALRTITITGAGGLTGGGNLTANRTISLSSATQSDIAKGVLAESWGDHANKYVGATAGNSTPLNVFNGDLNDIPRNGAYATFVSTAVANAPFSNTGGMLTLGLSSGITSQLLISRDGNNLGFRGSTTGDTYSPWRIVWHSGNLRSNTENDARYVQQTRTLTAGDGLTGGGNLTANRTFAVDGTVVRTSGNQTIAGIKTFSGEIRLPTTAGTGNNAIWVGAGVNPENVDDTVTVFSTTSTVDRAYLNTNYGSKSTGFMCMNSNTGTTYIKTGSNTWRTITSTVLS